MLCAMMQIIDALPELHCVWWKK